MCGIIGGTSTVEFDQSDIKLLFMLAMERGKDSCGIYNSNTNEVLKETGSSRSFVTNDLSGIKNWIGHTRAKTTGIVSNRNAHPFKYGELVGVHNGMISNFYQLKTEERLTYNDMEVDSEIIWYLMDKYGLEETLPRLTGSLALAWYKDETLHLYRHNNPISIAEYNGGWLFASKGDYFSPLGIEEWYDTEEHTLYTFKDGEPVDEVAIEAKPKETYHYSSRYTPTNRSGASCGYSGYVQGQNGESYRYWPSMDETRLTVETSGGGAKIYNYYDLLKKSNLENLKNDKPEVYDELIDTIKNLENEYNRTIN